MGAGVGETEVERGAGSLQGLQPRLHRPNLVILFSFGSHRVDQV